MYEGLDAQAGPRFTDAPLAVERVIDDQLAFRLPQMMGQPVAIKV